MDLNDFKKRGLVRKSSKDISLIKSLIKLSENDEVVTKKIKLNNLSARMILMNYYNILRMILEAIAADNELKIYSHEAYTYFLKTLGEDIFSEQFNRFRKLRNKLSYYGEDLSVEEVLILSDGIKKMTRKLKKKYLKKYQITYKASK